MIPVSGYPPPFNILLTARINLALADSKYFRAADRADTLGRMAPVLHSNRFGVLNFYVLSVFNTISLHVLPPSRFIV